MEPDDRDNPPLPPLPLGEGAATPAASADVFRNILHRHRRRQAAILGAGLVVALVAGSLAGFAAGRRGRGSAATQVASSGPASTATAGPQPAASGATANGGGFSSAGPASALPPTQLLVRDASDGTRVRLYSWAVPVPTPACASGQTCAQPDIAACVPTSMVTAEVSDDQVAGSADGMVWKALGVSGFDAVSAQVVGAGQPQPILVVVGHAGTDVANVTVKTADGTDTETPAPNGWVALAVRLPAAYHAGSGSDLPDGTVVASSTSGAPVTSSPLASVTGAVLPPCAIPPQVICNAGTAAASPGPAVPPAGYVPAPGTVTVQTAPAGSPCPPCVPVTAVPPTGGDTGVPGAVPGSGGGSSSAVGSSAIGSGSGGVAVSGSGAVVSGSGGAATVMCTASGGVSSSGTVVTSP
jgi:hypothetical protein